MDPFFERRYRASRGVVDPVGTLLPCRLPPTVDDEFLLLIADISGYTRVMMKNHTARVHAHGIISDLLSAVVEEVRFPLEVNKLEGDAMFMIAERQKNGWEAMGLDMGRRLEALISAADRGSWNTPSRISATASPASR